MSLSLAEQVAALPEDERWEVLGPLVEGGVTIEELVDAWWFWRRPEQHEPLGDWIVWLIQTGRGWGKTRTGAEWLLDRIERGECTFGALVGRTLDDVRTTMLNDPESGLVRCGAARGLDVRYVVGEKMVYVDRDGTTLARLKVCTSEKPDSPRGPNLDTAWCDELSSWVNKVDEKGNSCWTNLLFALRKGDRPRACVTTTPKPTRTMEQLNDAPYVTVTAGSLYDNLTNLAASFVDVIVGSFEGTRLAAQEIHGIYTGVVEGALWSPQQIEDDRWDDEPSARIKTTLGVDPPAEGGECGIVACGLYRVRHVRGTWRHHIGIVADYSLRGLPEQWAAAVIRAIRELDVDEVIVETNQGGKMVRAVLRAAGLGRVKVREVRVKEGKKLRADPISILQGRHRLHVIGQLPLLEGQMYGWDPETSDWSPDRLDAMVHAAEGLRPRVEKPPPRTHAPTGTNVPVRR